LTVAYRCVNATGSGGCRKHRRPTTGAATVSITSTGVCTRGTREI
jgi:hypothetical protein